MVEKPGKVPEPFFIETLIGLISNNLYPNKSVSSSPNFKALMGIYDLIEFGFEKIRKTEFGHINEKLIGNM